MTWSKFKKGGEKSEWQKAGEEYAAEVMRLTFELYERQKNDRPSTHRG